MGTDTKGNALFLNQPNADDYWLDNSFLKNIFLNEWNQEPRHPSKRSLCDAQKKETISRYKRLETNDKVGKITKNI